jgi:hypothetical protein
MQAYSLPCIYYKKLKRKMDNRQIAIDDCDLLWYLVRRQREVKLVWRCVAFNCVWDGERLSIWILLYAYCQCTCTVYMDIM